MVQLMSRRSQAAQLRIKKGQRVALKFINETGMLHPMHLHGHCFQVVGINGKSLNGPVPVRDTVPVPRSSTGQFSPLSTILNVTSLQKITFIATWS
jgi:FtsP/CotA-like multicopper oxidase with cupredoxin domain